MADAASFPEVFDLWQPAPLPAAAAVSFSANQEATHGTEASLWRLDLEREESHARDRLSSLEVQLQQVSNQQAQLPQRFERFLRRTESGVSFAASTGAVADPEMGLQSWLEQAQGDVSFAADSSPVPKSSPADEKAMLQRMSQLFLHAAWVETRVDGELIGQTTIGWGGKTRNLVPARATPGRSQQHFRNVTLAVASRVSLLNTLVLAQKCAAQLGMLLSMPGGVGAIAALPAAWKFVSKVLAETQGKA